MHPFFKSPIMCDHQKIRTIWNLPQRSLFLRNIAQSYCLVTPTFEFLHLKIKRFSLLREMIYFEEKKAFLVEM